MTPMPRAPWRPPGSGRQASSIAAWWLILLALLGVLAGCGESQPTAPAPAPPPSELVFLGLADDMPQAILDAFTRESGVRVRPVGYQSPEEVAGHIRASGDCDLAMVENQLVPSLIPQGLLAEIDWGKVPNFRNISAAFRDLAVDPGNRHSAPAGYGTMGLLVRTDLVGDGVRGWGDLWDPRYAGRIGLRAQPREIIGLTLVSLGHDFNSEDPQALAAAIDRLLLLRGVVTLLDLEADTAVPRLLSGEIAVLHGYAEDYRIAREANPAVAYVLPQEGTALWGDSYVIPAGTRHRSAAEDLLDFLLRGEVAAQYVEAKGYAQANDAALPLIEPGIRNDPVVYPPMEQLRGAHLTLPLSPEGERRYAELWERFVAGGGTAVP